MIHNIEYKLYFVTLFFCLMDVADLLNRCLLIEIFSCKTEKTRRAGSNIMFWATRDTNDSVNPLRPPDNDRYDTVYPSPNPFEETSM